MKKNILIYLLVMLNIGMQANAQQAERILDFHSDIVIDTTGRIKVTETITVYAEGNFIQRGIVRSIPRYRKDNQGKKKKMDFTVLSVQRNGVAEPYHTEIANGNKDIFMGSSDIFLKSGVHKYTITYESYGHVGFFDEYDELYWNVTGNEWLFCIEKASASITLPEGASFMNAACYTGAYGESNENNCSFREQDGTCTFHTNVALNPNEGLTVAVAFTPHIIKRPPPPSFAEQYGSMICAAFLLFILCCYYVFTWYKVGRDPQKPIVVPTFNPPNDWSAPIVRRLYKREHDSKAMTVTLVDMAVKRLIRIRQEEQKGLFKSKTYVLENLTTEETIAGDQEMRILNYLFPGNKKKLIVSNKNHAKFTRADNDLRNKLPTYDKKEIFRHNYKYGFFAALLTLAVLGSYLYFFGSTDALITVLFTSTHFFIGSILFVQAIFGIMKPRIMFLIVGFFFIAIALFMQQLFLLGIEEVPFLNIFVLITELLFPIYFSLIKAPTKLSKQIEAELKGFRMYLKTAEENRLNLLTPPDRTPELFEKLLPYAIALDVENAWSKKFNNVLKQANYSPDWYQGTSNFQAIHFANSFSRSFGSSVQQAKVNPTASSSSGGFSSGSSSWSSGSSGGGFSGGGGGGGGGRGW